LHGLLALLDQLDGAALHVEPLPLLGGRLEIRIIGVGQGTELVLPTDHEVALEVRTGNAIVTTNGEREEHAAGDIWVVPMNARVTIAASDEVTVLRAMVFIKE
jgi:quercetin dioxygenase-like cupin family protein